MRLPESLKYAWLVPLLLLLVGAGPAKAGLVVSPVVVDFSASQPARSDIELFNEGAERLYIVVEPSRIVDAGKPTEHRVVLPDPEKVGLLATPSRLILEPGQRSYLRIAILSEPGATDQIFRVTIKPVVGDVETKTTGLKILVGYDVLVVQRPAKPTAEITGSRNGNVLTLRNVGNTNAELFAGRQCDGTGKLCTGVAGGRLYDGEARDIPLHGNGPVSFSVKVGDQVKQQTF